MDSTATQENCLLHQSFSLPALRHCIHDLRRQGQKSLHHGSPLRKFTGAGGLPASLLVDDSGQGHAQEQSRNKFRLSQPDATVSDQDVVQNPSLIFRVGISTHRSTRKLFRGCLLTEILRVQTHVSLWIENAPVTRFRKALAGRKEFSEKDTADWLSAGI